jgi:uncharacterized membrane protein YsdA (DUF1294 family)
MEHSSSGEYERGPRKGVSIGDAVFLLALLLFPSLAVWRIAGLFDPRFVFGYVTLISITAFLFYWHDKRRAEAGEWRTPESRLHLVEFLGGWPGAFLAQRALRHKSSKVSYQVDFWFIVAAHEFAAFDFLQNWKFFHKAISLLHG